MLVPPAGLTADKEVGVCGVAVATRLELGESSMVVAPRFEFNDRLDSSSL